MNVQDQCNIYLVVIPRNYTNDIHICGRCKIQYTLLNLFLKHKEICNETDLNEPNSKGTMGKNANGNNNLIQLGSLESFDETVEKNQNNLNLLQNFLIKDENQIMQYKVESFEGQKLFSTEKNISTDGKNVFEQKENSTVAGDWKRNLQNDEEDVATLLANQLSSETTADDLGGDDSVEVRPVEPAQATISAKESTTEEKEEIKVLYRGKMRKLFSCQVEGCVYKTLLRKDIERHSRVHTGERPFKCFLCEKAFNRTDKLLLHQRIHAGDKRYKCTKCDYASVDSGSLIKHLRVHNGERPFKCQLCSYRARDSSQLTVHLRTHTGDSPFICTNSKCKAAFKTNSDLKRHMVVHSDEKPHSCTYCPYKSTLKRNLQIHVQSQHPNGELREYKCHLCPRFVLPTSRKLKNHIRKHHGASDEKLGETIEKKGNLVEKKRRKRKGRKMAADKTVVGIMNKAYDCKLCDASFVCRDSLLTHRRYHSKIDGETRKSEGNPDWRREKPEVEAAAGNAESPNPDDLDLNVEVDNSFTDSLRNAEILASLNSTNHGIGNVRHYVTIEPEVVQNVYDPEEYDLVGN